MGTLLSAAFTSSEAHTTQTHTTRQNWLEAATDGLLTIEGERFMLSLPASLRLDWLAVLRPQIINELAQLSRFRQTILRRIEELLRIELRHGIEGRHLDYLRAELACLRDWIQADSPGAEAA